MASRFTFRCVTFIALLSACGQAPLASAAATSAPSGQKPNLLFLFADQLRYQSLGYAGDTKAHTPNLDRLAAQSVNFQHAVSSTPVCAAFRASLFTGKYASSTGMVVNELRMNPNHRCFAHVLNDAGYRVGYIGKWHLWANQAGHHLDPRNHFVPPGPYRLGFDGYWAGFNFHHGYYNAHYHRDSPEKVFYGKDVYEPDGQTDLAIDFIRRAAQGDAPFALFVSYGTPHDPWTTDNVPQSCYDRFKDVDFPLPPNWSETPDPRMDRETDPRRWQSFWKTRLPDFQRVYYAMTTNLDANVGRLLKAIDEADLARNTVVVFTSDHGEMFGAHGRVYKMIFYDEAVRVPFLIRWPSHIPANTISHACLGTPDIMPTVLSLMQLPVPREVEGMDLSHLARGRSGPEPEAAFMQGMGHTYQWKNGFEWRALRDKQYTYAVYRTDRCELLFDNSADPLQMTNLADSRVHEETLQRFRRMLDTKMAALNDTFQTCTWYRDHWMKDRSILHGAMGGTCDLNVPDQLLGRYFPPQKSPG